MGRERNELWAGMCRSDATAARQQVAWFGAKNSTNGCDGGVVRYDGERVVLRLSRDGVWVCRYIYCIVPPAQKHDRTRRGHLQRAMQTAGASRLDIRDWLLKHTVTMYVTHFWPIVNYLARGAEVFDRREAVWHTLAWGLIFERANMRSFTEICSPEQRATSMGK